MGKRKEILSIWKWNKKIYCKGTAKTNLECKLITDYIKNNKILQDEEKEKVFTAIKIVNKNAALIADADNAILKKQMEKSIILQELEKKIKITYNFIA